MMLGRVVLFVVLFVFVMWLIGGALRGRTGRTRR